MLNKNSQEIINKLSAFCKEHPFSPCDPYKNIYRNLDGDPCGFIGHFPHVCSVYVEDEAVKIVVEHERDFNNLNPDHATISKSCKFEARYGEDFDDLTPKQQDTVRYICESVCGILNAK